MPDVPAVMMVADSSEDLIALEAELENLHCRCVTITYGEDAQ